MKDISISLFQYHQWSLNKLLQHIDDLPHEVFTANVTNVFPSISHTFGHMFSVDLLWFSRMQGKSPDTIPNGAFTNLLETKQTFSKLHNEIHAFLETHDDHSMIVTYYNTKGSRVEN